MKTVATKVVVEGPNPGDANNFYYREEHEYRNLDPLASDGLTAFMAEAEDFIKKHHGHKEDDANLTATLSAVVDGVAVPDIKVNGVSYFAMHAFEEWAAKKGADLINMGKQHGQQKFGKQWQAGGHKK